MILTLQQCALCHRCSNTSTLCWNFVRDINH